MRRWSWAFLRSWRLPDAEPEERGVLDLSDGVVTFLWNGRVQHLRIADGRSTEIDQAHESGCSGTTFAQLEEIGLFYAFSSICSGKEVRRVTFLPADDVARAFDEDTGARAR